MGDHAITWGATTSDKRMRTESSISFEPPSLLSTSCDSTYTSETLHTTISCLPHALTGCSDFLRSDGGARPQDRRDQDQRLQRSRSHLPRHKCRWRQQVSPLPGPAVS